MKVDIHNYEKRLQYFLNKLNEIDKENREDILKFVKYLFAEGISKGRIAKYVYCLINIAKFLNKSFKDANKDDIVGVKKTIMKLNKGERMVKSSYNLKITIIGDYHWKSHKQANQNIWESAKANINPKNKVVYLGIEGTDKEGEYLTSYGLVDDILSIWKSERDLKSLRQMINEYRLPSYYVDYERYTREKLLDILYTIVQKDPLWINIIGIHGTEEQKQKLWKESQEVDRSGVQRLLNFLDESGLLSRFLERTGSNIVHTKQLSEFLERECSEEEQRKIYDIGYQDSEWPDLTFKQTQTYLTNYLYGVSSFAHALENEFSGNTCEYAILMGLGHSLELSTGYYPEIVLNDRRFTITPKVFLPFTVEDPFWKGRLDRILHEVTKRKKS